MAETAYQMWTYDCGGDVRCVADQLGVTTDKINRWAREQQWHDRRRRELLPELKQYWSMFTFELAQGLPEMARVARQLAVNAPADKDKVNAIRAFTDLARVAFLSGIMQDDETVMVDTSSRDISPEALTTGHAALASQIMEHNVAQQETRKTKRRSRT